MCLAGNVSDMKVKQIPSVRIRRTKFMNDLEKLNAVIQRKSDIT